MPSCLYNNSSGNSAPTHNLNSVLCYLPAAFFMATQCSDTLWWFQCHLNWIIVIGSTKLNGDRGGKKKNKKNGKMSETQQRKQKFNLHAGNMLIWNWMCAVMKCAPCIFNLFPLSNYWLKRFWIILFDILYLIRWLVYCHLALINPDRWSGKQFGVFTVWPPQLHPLREALFFFSFFF